MASKRLTATLVGVAALAMLVVGCGGSDDGSEEAQAQEPLTKAQYVKRASALCSKGGQAVGQGLVTQGKELSQSGVKKSQKEEGIAMMEKVILPGFKTEVENLAQLPAPKGDEPQVEAILKAFEAGLEVGEETLDSSLLFVAKDSEFLKGTKLAEKYGIENCGQVFL